MARRRNEIVPETSSRFGRGPHQFRTRNDLTQAQRTRSSRSENATKSRKTIDIPSLITVWLQVRVLPGPPTISAGLSIRSRSDSDSHDVTLRAPDQLIIPRNWSSNFLLLISCFGCLFPWQGFFGFAVLDDAHFCACVRRSICRAGSGVCLFTVTWLEEAATPSCGVASLSVCCADTLRTRGVYPSS
jgi:hypothetical protein